MASNMFKRQTQILAAIQSEGGLTIEDVRKKFAVSRPTASSDLRSLKERGEIETVPDMWPTVYRVRAGTATGEATRHTEGPAEPEGVTVPPEQVRPAQSRTAPQGPTLEEITRAEEYKSVIFNKDNTDPELFHRLKGELPTGNYLDFYLSQVCPVGKKKPDIGYLNKTIEKLETAKLAIQLAIYEAEQE